MGNDYAAHEGDGSGCNLTSYMDKDCIVNRDDNACNHGNWKGGGGEVDAKRDVSHEDL
jgi:hypothetical protein